MANTKVQSEQIEDGSITADKLADGTIVAAELADNAVETAAINADAVTGAKIADNAIDSEHYTDGSIDTAHIADAQITVGKMAANSVDSDQYVDGSIDTVHIADAQVTTAKITDGNISTGKIADNAVTSAKIDTNIDIAGTFDVTGATTLDAGLTVGAGTVLIGADSGDSFNSDSMLRLQRTGDRVFMQFKTDADQNSGILFGDVDDDVECAIEYEPANKALTFSTGNNVEAIRIDTSGNVLVGTTDVNPSDNGASGDAGHAIAASGYLASARSDDTVALFNRMDSDGDVVDFRKNGTILGSISTVGGAQLKVVAQGNLHFNQNGNSANRSLNFTGTSFKPFDSSDNTLDLGTSGGRWKDLYLSGQALVQSGATSAPSFAFVNDTNTGMSRPTTDTINFVTGGTERIRITNAGKLCVNTTSAINLAHTFEVNHAGNNVAVFNNIVTSGNPFGIQLRYSGTGHGTGGDAYTYYSHTSGSYVLKFGVRATGNVVNANNSYGQVSDRKLKENIVDATNKLDELKQIKIRNFNFIGDDTKQIGVVAQELETIFPALITDTEDVDADGNNAGTTTKEVKYSVLLPIAIKAIQEQQTIIEAQTTSINDLKTRIEALES